MPRHTRCQGFGGVRTNRFAARTGALPTSTAGGKQSHRVLPHAPPTAPKVFYHFRGASSLPGLLAARPFQTFAHALQIKTLTLEPLFDFPGDVPLAQQACEQRTPVNAACRIRGWRMVARAVAPRPDRCRRELLACKRR